MSFIKDDFLLTTPTAKLLFNEFAKDAPIFDWHCHLIPEQIARDHHFANITDVWLRGDHYKWRLMRLGGIDEKYITHEGTDEEKFKAYCKILPLACGNPVYHWSHLELQRFFDIDDEINERNADKLWLKCNDIIAKPEFSARALMRKSKVKFVCTSDDPADDLKFHKLMAQDPNFEIKVFPAFRPDKILNIELQGFKDEVKRLEKAANLSICSFDDLKRALVSRIDFFHNNGARHCDHGFDVVRFEPADLKTLNEILEKGLAGENLCEKECAQYRTALLCFLAGEYKKKQWIMQIHIGAMRSINQRMLKTQGRDCGYDSSSDRPFLDDLAKFLDYLDSNGALPDTVLFSLNPNVDLALNNLAGCYPGDGEYAKVQLGPAWWMNDHIDGMTRQLVAYANSGLLGTFIGMVTDSRSFLSYPRFEYFRRILCNFIGGLVDKGEFSSDLNTLGKIINNICYDNAYAKYFKKQPR